MTATNLILRQTTWYEGSADWKPAVDVYEHRDGGGWPSVADMKSKRLADLRKHTGKTVSETEFGFRTEEECRGAYAGLTRIEVVELIAA